MLRWTGLKLENGNRTDKNLFLDAFAAPFVDVVGFFVDVVNSQTYSIPLVAYDPVRTNASYIFPSEQTRHMNPAKLGPNSIPISGSSRERNRLLIIAASPPM